MSNLIDQMLTAGGIPVEVKAIGESANAGAPEAQNREFLSQAEENLKAAKLLLSELLEQPAYRTLKLTEARRESLVQSAVRTPLPGGTDRVEVIKGSLKKSLKELRKEEKAAMPQTPQRGRMRPTLCFDHKTPMPPSKAIDCAIPFSQLKYNEEKYKSPEDYLSTLERKHGSESETANLEREQREGEYAQATEALNLRLPVRSILDRAPSSCTNCGEPIPADRPRSTILRVDQPTLERIGAIKAIAVHCEQCCDANPENQSKMATLEDESWTADLTPDELEAYELRREGLKQADIGAKMIPARSQATASRLLKQVDQKRRAFRAGRLRKTGGA
jgi:hypothetical protein